MATTDPGSRMHGASQRWVDWRRPLSLNEIYSLQRMVRLHFCTETWSAKVDPENCRGILELEDRERPHGNVPKHVLFPYRRVPCQCSSEEIRLRMAWKDDDREKKVLFERMAQRLGAVISRIKVAHILEFLPLPNLNTGWTTEPPLPWKSYTMCLRGVEQIARKAQKIHCCLTSVNLSYLSGRIRNRPSSSCISLRCGYITRFTHHTSQRGNVRINCIDEAARRINNDGQYVPYRILGVNHLYKRWTMDEEK